MGFKKMASRLHFFRPCPFERWAYRWHYHNCCD